MRVTDLKPRSIIEVAREDSLREAARHLADDDIGALAIFDATGAAGILSERDLARAVADEVDLDKTPVEDYMTSAPVRVAADSALGDAIAKINEFGVRHLLVDDDGDITGMISVRDVMALLGTDWPEI
jgi:predicted transcriptional regulator